LICVILGPDYALAHAKLREIRQQRDPSGDTTSTLDGKSTSIRQVIMDISSIGFFSAGRVVIVEDLIGRLGKQGAKDGGSTPDWPALFAAVQPESTLILVDTSVQSIPAAVKKALPKDAMVFASSPPRGPQLIAWIQDQAKRQGSSMDQATARDLAMSLYPQSWAQEPRNPAYDRPPDMEMLGNEIARLALAAYPNPISQAIVRELVVKESEDKLFTFLDAASSGNIGVAVVELDKLLNAGEDPAKLLAQLSQNVELGSVMSAAGRRNPTDVGKDIGLANANRMTSIQRGLQGQPMSASLRRVPLATDADRKMKTGALREPLDALYDVMLTIAAGRLNSSAR
jgi:DNA polymerase III delta subunit